MKLFDLGINLLQQFNPEDGEDFPLLKRQAEDWANDQIIDAEKNGKKNIGSITAGWNKLWFVRVAVGFLYIYLSRAILDYLNPVASGKEAKRGSDYERDDVQSRYERFLKFEEYEKG